MYKEEKSLLKWSMFVWLGQNALLLLQKVAVERWLCKLIYHTTLCVAASSLASFRDTSFFLLQKVWLFAA